MVKRKIRTGRQAFLDARRLDGALRIRSNGFKTSDSLCDQLGCVKGKAYFGNLI